MEPSLAETDGASARAKVAAANGDRAIEATRTPATAKTKKTLKPLNRPLKLFRAAFVGKLSAIPRIQGMSVLPGPRLST